MEYNEIIVNKISNFLTLILRFVWYIHLPILIRFFVLNIYCWVFNVNKKEMVKPVISYLTLNSFFTRDIKERLIANNKFISPCNSMIQKFGK